MRGEPSWQGLLDAAIVAAIRALPWDTRLRWNDALIDPVEGYTAGWADVTIRPLSGLLGIDHICQVFGPEELAKGVRPRALDIVMEPDAIAFISGCGPGVHARLIRPGAGRGSIEADLAELLGEGFAEPVRTVDGITARLAHRIRQLTGRSDLVVAWDPAVLPSFLAGLDHQAAAPLHAAPAAELTATAPPFAEFAVPAAACTPRVVAAPSPRRTVR